MNVAERNISLVFWHRVPVLLAWPQCREVCQRSANPVYRDGRTIVALPGISAVLWHDQTCNGQVKRRPQRICHWSSRQRSWCLMACLGTNRRPENKGHSTAAKGSFACATTGNDGKIKRLLYFGCKTIDRRS